MIKLQKLTQVADIEYRPTKDKIYPKGTIIIQISATRGQTLILKKDRMIDSHYAVVLPKIDPFYLFVAIQKFFPKFFHARKQGLNFRSEELNYFSLPIHQDQSTQKTIGRTMQILGAGDYY